MNRIRYIPFLNKFEPSPTNIAKVDNLKLNHRDAFFSWCVNGSHKYFSTGVLPRTTLQTEGTVSLAIDNNTLVRFIQEYCVTEEKTLNPVTKRYKTTVYPTTTFKTDYLNMYPKASVETLKTDMRMRGHRCDRDSAGRMSFFGIRAKTTDDVHAEAKAARDAEAQAAEFDEEFDDAAAADVLRRPKDLTTDPVLRKPKAPTTRKRKLDV